MPEGDAFSFDQTFNVTGDQNQILQGKNEKITIANTKTMGDEIDFFAELRKGLQQESSDPKVVQQAERDAIRPLEDLCKQPLPESEADQKKLKEKIFDMVRGLDPYVPYVRKTIAAFAEGALKTIPPPISWAVGGCLEVIRDHRRD